MRRYGSDLRTAVQIESQHNAANESWNHEKASRVRLALILSCDGWHGAEQGR